MEIEETRRLNLLALIAKHGGQRQLAEAAGIKNPAQVSQWVNRSPDAKTGRPRVMSSQSARAIEAALSLSKGWMDQVNSDYTQERLRSYLEMPDQDPNAPETPESMKAKARLWDVFGGSVREAESPAYMSARETPPGYVRFELIDAKGGAGPGVVNVEYPEVMREVEIAEWQLLKELGRVPSPRRVKLLTVRGNSMSPRIREGDVVFVDVEDTAPVDGAIFAVIIHDETLVKQIERRMDGLHIVSLAYPERPDIIPPDRMDALRIAGRVLGAIQLRKAQDL